MCCHGTGRSNFISGDSLGSLSPNLMLSERIGHQKAIQLNSMREMRARRNEL